MSGRSGLPAAKFAIVFDKVVLAATAGEKFPSCSLEGLAAFQNLFLSKTTHPPKKYLYLQYLDSSRLPFSMSLRRKCFSLHSPQTENVHGFDSHRHIFRCFDMKSLNAIIRAVPFTGS